MNFFFLKKEIANFSPKNSPLLASSPKFENLSPKINNFSTKPTNFSPKLTCFSPKLANNSSPKLKINVFSPKMSLNFSPKLRDHYFIDEQQFLFEYLQNKNLHEKDDYLMPLNSKSLVSPDKTIKVFLSSFFFDNIFIKSPNKEKLKKIEENSQRREFLIRVANVRKKQIETEKF